MRFDELGHTCVVGLQWGDEGKGKIVDALVEHFDIVVRFSGGANAGHTIVFDGKKFALHQLPTGVLRDRVISVIGCGAVVDPAVLLGEIESLRQRGINVGDRLRISDRCQLVFPYHRRQDIMAENINDNGLSIAALKLNAATGIIVTVTAYSAEVNQTDSTPHITASNKHVKEGYIALSRDLEKDLGLHFGDLILLEGGIYGIFEFQDRMHKRKKRQVDIFYYSTKKAIEFGVKKATLRVAVKTKEA